MENKPLNIFVLGEHALVLNGLRRKLNQKFGSTMQVSIFCDFHQCLKKIDSQTDVVVIDDRLEGRGTEELVSKLRAIHPGMEVVMHRSSDHVISQLRMMLHRRLLPEAASVFALV